MHTEETKAKISATMRGRQPPASSLANLTRSYWVGKQIPSSARAKMATANRARFAMMTPEERREYRRPSQEASVARLRKGPLKQYGYGLTVSDYDAMLAAQGGACRLCGLAERHRRNGKARLLCSRVQPVARALREIAPSYGRLREIHRRNGGPAVIYARSDMMEVRVSGVDHGHRRNVDREATRKAREAGDKTATVYEPSFAIACAKCEAGLAGDPGWSKTAHAIPKTPDEADQDKRAESEGTTLTSMMAKAWAQMVRNQVSGSN